MELFDTATVLTRVMTSGVVMSIEKSDRELPGLERLLAKRTGRAKVVLVNSRSAAVHAALVGQGIGHGDEIHQPGLSEKDRAFLSWLGVSVREDGPEGELPAFGQLSLTAANADRLAELAGPERAPALVLDLTGLGFGPAAAVLPDAPRVWARPKRLKIFGAYALRTMWTQQEEAAALTPGVQFNYRLSPLVAACVRMAVHQAVHQAVRPLAAPATTPP